LEHRSTGAGRRGSTSTFPVPADLSTGFSQQTLANKMKAKAIKAVD
jgi:hypothetical protein